MKLSEFALLLEGDKYSQIKKKRQAEASSQKKTIEKEVIPLSFVKEKQFLSDLEHLKRNEPKYFEQINNEINDYINNKRVPMAHKVSYKIKGKFENINDSHLLSPTSDWILLWYMGSNNTVIFYRVGRHAFLQLGAGK